MKTLTTLLTATALTATAAHAVDLEVTHWWTSGGEAAAVAEFAKAFNENTDHNWVDGAIAGSGGTARPIMISRITGGDPMGATQFNHGRQAEELVEAGLLRSMTLNGRAVYEHDYGYPQHDHLHCEKCNKLIEFQSDEFAELRQAVAAAHKFRVKGHRLIINGICEECSQVRRQKRKLDLI